MVSAVKAAMDAVTLCRELVRARTVTGNEGEAADVAERWMRDLGYDRVWRDELGNLIGALDGKRPGGVLIDGHLDVVEPGDVSLWRCDPFSGDVIDGALYGRGAVDMKGPVAAMILGVAALRDRPAADRSTVYVCCSVAEETIEGLALRSVLEALRPWAVVIGEPTSGAVAIGQRGRAEILIEAVGRAAHSAYPQAGVNSAEAMVDLIADLRAAPVHTDDLLGPGFLVLTEVWSTPRPAFSIIPYLTSAVYDRRLLPGETPDTVLAPIRAIAERRTAPGSAVFRASVAEIGLTTYAGVTIRGQKFAPGWKLAPSHPLVQAACAGLRDAGFEAKLSAYASCTNGSASAGRLGIPTIGYGPGQNAKSHQVNECIPVPELEQGVSGYAALAWAAATASLPGAPEGNVG
jgi:putative selenium metabolism hydrolase